MNHQQLEAWLNKAIVDTSKTGEQELLQLIWALAACFDNRLKRDADKLADNSNVHLPINHSQVLAVGSQIVKALGRCFKDIDFSTEPLGPASLRVHCEELFNGRLTKDAQQDCITKMVSLINVALPGLSCFKVNLLMVNYRTINGGAWDHNNLLELQSKPQDDLTPKVFCRPFESYLPDYASALLGVINRPNLRLNPHNHQALVSFKPLADKTYLLPSGFTVSFPIQKEQIGACFARVGHGDLEQKYQSIGSFGLSEPGFYTWEKALHQECFGSRLSLRAYSINSEFLLSIQQRLTSLSELGGKDWSNYRKYGGVSITHINKLVRVFNQGNTGLNLAVDWALDLANMTLGLADGVSFLGEIPGEFISYIKGKVVRRINKLNDTLDGSALKPVKVLDSKHQVGDTAAFDKVWVVDANLWELLMLLASGMTLPQLARTLRLIDNQWQPNLFVAQTPDTVADVQLQDELQCDKQTLIRTLFCSGTSAAIGVSESLKSLLNPVKTLKVTIDNQWLSTFSPYFAISNAPLNFARMANKMTERTSSGASTTTIVMARAQIWANLSDDLHGLCVNSSYQGAAGILADVLLTHTQLIKQSCSTMSFEQAVLVIDYTKFGADLPSTVLYPLLMNLARELKSHRLVLEVLFFRANLKYNTGALDRYQCGEVLSSGQLSAPINTQLLVKANQSFSSTDAQKHRWRLREQYIPLMKRLYLLSDFVLQRRFSDYEALYRQTDIQGNCVRVKQLKLALFVDYRLQSLFTALVMDIAKHRFQEELSATLRKQVKSFWTKTLDAKKVIDEFNPLHSDILNLQVEEVSLFIARHITQMAGEFNKLKLKTVHDKHKKIALGSYRSRLLSVAKKVNELP